MIWGLEDIPGFIASKSVCYSIPLPFDEEFGVKRIFVLENMRLLQ